MKTLTLSFLVCSLSFGALSTGLSAESKKLKIFILAGQSNMQGHAKTSVIENRLKDDKLRASVAFLQKDGAFIKRDDVYINHLEKKMKGKLSVGYGADSMKVGPELSFGWTMGDKLDEDVLIIKAAWGGKSLHRDFLSPNGKMPSAEYIKNAVEKGKKKTKDLTEATYKEGFGHYYRLMMAGVQESIKNLKTYSPNYKGQGYEIAGFVWFQGYNDKFSDHATSTYQENMANFIRDVRKDLKSPMLPFVIGAMGHNGKAQKGTTKILADAQIATAQMPEFKGNVITVKTADFWDYKADELFNEWRSKRKRSKKNKSAWPADEKAKWQAEWNKHGSNKPYHYNGSAMFMIDTGNGLGEAMLKLLKK
jgi:alpha-galactosidase